MREQNNHLIPILFRKKSYIQRVLDIQSANLIAYYPLNETTGTNAANAEGTAARDGTYTGVTLNSIIGPDGVNGAPLFDGSNDFVDIFSASLNTAWGAPAAGTVAAWARVSAAGVWEDSTQRFMLGLRHADTDNRIRMRKSATNDRVDMMYDAGGTLDQINVAPISLTAWMHWAITWNVADDEMKAYLNGVQQGATQTAIGTLVGNLQATLTVIGAETTGPARVWDGYLAHVPIWTTTLTQSEILSLATV